MCLYSTPQDVRSALAGRDASDYMIGWKVYKKCAMGWDPEVMSRSVRSLYQNTKINTSNQVVVAKGRMVSAKTSLRCFTRINAGIHFYKSLREAKCARAINGNHSYFIVKVYAKVSDIIGVGTVAAAAKKVIIDSEDLKRMRHWVTSGSR